MITNNRESTHMKNAAALSFAAAMLLVSGSMLCAASRSPEVNKLTYHGDAQRTGWNTNESILTPEAVKSGSFTLLWQSPPLDSFGHVPPRLFATPLFLHSVEMTSDRYRGRRFSVAYVVTSTGYAYAIAAKPDGEVAPGTILWRTQLSAKPCAEGQFGNLSTPVIDLDSRRMYVESCDDDKEAEVHALDIGSGQDAPGWPININAAAIDGPALNRNGIRHWARQPHLQRGALNLSPDGQRLYVAFGPDAGGWLVVIDVATRKVASAFASTALDGEDQGGMWSSSGPSIDSEGRIHIATGANFDYAIHKRKIAGVFPDSEGHWGNSILQLRDDRTKGLTLTGTYSPFNYCQTASADIDLGSSGTIAIDLPAQSTSTPRLLVLGGGKQGNFYLLDRDHMPGGTVKRHPCSMDPESDGSLLAPDPQPHFGLLGPINLFGPYSDYISMLDQAKSRSTAAYFRDANGRNLVFVSGSTKTGDDFTDSMPPGLARVEIVTKPGQAAYPRVDGFEKTQTFVNPGSPVVSSNGSKDAIVWVLDPNARRTQSLYGDDAPKPILYAFDALTFELLWKNEPGVLFASGKYNEPTIADGLVLVGTDRLQAFGMQSTAKISATETGRPLFDGKSLKGWSGDPTLWSVRDDAITGAADERLATNSFLISDERFSDFELHLKYRFLTPDGNSGIQFRSSVIDPAHFVMAGYQANVMPTSAPPERFGMLYDEAGDRDVLTPTGEKVELRANGKGIQRTLETQVNSPARIVQAVRPYPQWNDYVVMACGNRIVTALNGYLLTDTIDNDPRGAREGKLGFQIHAGMKMGVQFKDIFIKPLAAPPSTAHFLITSSAAASSSDQATASGRQIFQRRCTACHGSGQPGILARSVLSSYPKQRIIDALLRGPMKGMASGLSEKQVDDVASYLKSDD
jgi:outer membrane protein assembly factor BamB